MSRYPVWSYEFLVSDGDEQKLQESLLAVAADRSKPNRTIGEELPKLRAAAGIERCNAIIPARPNEKSFFHHDRLVSCIEL